VTAAEGKASAVDARRAFVTFAGLRELSASCACELVKVSRRRLGYVGRKNDRGALGAIEGTGSGSSLRFGYRRLHAMLRREGKKIQPQASASALSSARTEAVAEGSPQAAWDRHRRAMQGGISESRVAYDFLFDQCENGRKLKVLTVTDEFTRLCLEIEVEYRMTSAQVAQRCCGCSPSTARRRTFARTTGRSSLPKRSCEC